MSDHEMFTTGWRIEMVEKGLKYVDDAMSGFNDWGVPLTPEEQDRRMQAAAVYVAAANVRSRPADSIRQGNL